jgi:hypothetical protein
MHHCEGLKLQAHARSTNEFDQYSVIVADAGDSAKRAITKLAVFFL